MTAWPLVRLGEILAPVSRSESLRPTERYSLLGAHWYAEGLYIKDIKAGSQIQAKQLFRVKAGDFVYNRLFAWKGSFALAGSDVDGCYVSNEFPCFTVHADRVDGRYLWYYFSRESVWSEALGFSTGGTPTSRNRLKEERLLAMSMPLPPLEEQRRIVGRIDRVADQAHQSELLLAESEAEASALLMAVYHQIADSAPRKALAEVAPLHRRPVPVDSEKTYPQVAVRSFGRGTFHREPLVGADVTWQKPFLVNAGDILISNIKAWEGAIAVANEADDAHVGSHRYLTCVPIPTVAIASFVCFHLLTPEGLDEVGQASPGSADRNRTLSTKALLRIPIPLPAFDKQVKFDELCRKVSDIRILHRKTVRELDALVPSLLAQTFDCI
jgi:type I restriction enzyme S subunit